MFTRSFSKIVLALALSTVSIAYAFSLADISNKDATAGVRTALEKGADVAVEKLGVKNGFLNNDKVKIGLPNAVEQAMPLLRMMGQGKKLDELQVQMNHAAESAVAQAKPLLMSAVKSMSVTDAKNILTGGETSVTDFFRSKTSVSLNKQFLPTVKKITDKNNLSSKYNTLMGKANQSGLISDKESTVEGYVTEQAINGLYTIIAEEEKAIRADPLGTGSAILSKVFGGIK